MAITIGREEIVLLLGAATAGAALFTALGRWTSKRTGKEKEERDAAISQAVKSALQGTAVKQIRDDLDDHLVEARGLIGEFQELKGVTITTARQMEANGQMMGELLAVHRETLKEIRETNRALRELANPRPARTAPG